MDDATFSPNSMLGAFPETAMDLDFMDELLLEGCWLETTDTFDFLQPGPLSSAAVNDPPQFLPCSAPNTGLNINIHPHQQFYQQKPERKSSGNSSLVFPKIEELQEHESQNPAGFESSSSFQYGHFAVEGSESGRSLWTAPSVKSGPSSSVKDRLFQAIIRLQEYVKDRNVLVQVWVPIRMEGRHVLTTAGQPYSLDPNCKSLASYRNISETYQFPADEDSKELVGLPGRVFLRKLPEYTPDVRFFRRDEYPQVGYAEKYGVRGCLALPVFEQGSRICLGVVEIITTSLKTSYRLDLENVCQALEAVNLRSSQNFSTPSAKARSNLYHARLQELSEVLTSVCQRHSFPLALTWVSCDNEAEGGCLQSDENYAHCFCTVNSACFAASEKLSGFLDACSEHQLLQGQGLVGKAFLTGQQCFAADITAFSKSKYPLSHHARLFGLSAAVAIPLRSINTGLVEYILEFFFPKQCQDTKEQKWMLNLLSMFIEESCQTINLAIGKELEEIILPIRETGVASDVSSPSKETSSEQSSWVAQMIEAQRKGKGVSVSWDYHKEPKEEFSVTTHWDDARAESYHRQVFPELGQFPQNCVAKSGVEGGVDSSSLRGRRLEGIRKSGERRQTKTEKTISLQVLRQYFAGSLKDAAKSIGVCPTTLKRICRQHGITRWPSRKLKKVGHSLRKLQLVIDSVQGAEGSIQIGSFYESFPELSSPNDSGNGPFSSVKTGDHSKPLNSQPDNGLFRMALTVSKSPSPSCSQSSGSSTCCTGANQNTATISALSSRDTLDVQDSGRMLKRAHSDADLNAMNQEEPKFIARSQSHLNLESLPPLPKGRKHSPQDSSTFRVKATFGEEKIRFSLQPNWLFKDIQQEIAKRFSIDDFNRVNIKYLDDDHEWVLLTCDADLEECIDIHKSSQSHTIKVSLQVASHLKLGKVLHSSMPY
ncbi:protein NLP1-like [Mangifera indica]|uniref:protein NLP1-like n=1 Tax=Mangifera indica TaxID=29780 RepID=UPI001CFAF8A9|nr:protein NLP1-like [Mangifera indica]XP_044489096.1 protein NLP1-like [Mangifera indica]XP_044489097.1 protein NLP1-like [Mangifera indica]XP_044489098.1 protein NLP1-like [Mangifera indica]